MKIQYFIFLIAAFFLSELILGLNVVAGFLVYAVLVGVVLISLERDLSWEHSEKLLLFLMIVPIARMAEIFVGFSLVWKSAVFYLIVLFLVVYYCGKFNVNPGYSRRRMGFLIFTALIGIALGLIGNSFFSFPKNYSLIWILPFIALSEELLFRGMILNYARKEYGSIFSIFAVSLLAAVFSMSFGFGFFYFTLIVNLITSLIYDRTGNIWLVIPINFFVTLFLFVI